MLRLSNVNILPKLAAVIAMISMIVGGATALLVLGRYRMPAASLMLAGLFALLVLIPRVRTWVEDRTARGNGAAAAFASAEKEHS